MTEPPDKPVRMKGSLFRRFINLNIRASNYLEQFLPQAFTRSLLYLHEQEATSIIKGRIDPTVLDVGGGRASPFARNVVDTEVFVIACDIDHEELIENRIVESKVVLDATSNLPFADNSVDIIVTRSVLEHLNETRTFISEMERVLRPGGRFLHVFPCRFSPFSLVNQILPNKIAQKILYSIFPEWSNACGFKAFYNHCFYPSMPNAMRSAGLRINEIHLRYYQAIYFKFFIPLYLVFLGYDFLLYLMNVKFLACQMTLIGEKSGD